VEALLQAVRKLEVSRLVGPFNLGSEERISIGQLVKEVIAASGKNIEVVWDSSKPTLIWGQSLNCDFARQLLDGWEPVVGLQEGLAHCYRHIAERLNKGEETPISRQQCNAG
jgi:nucleoside-diphosphate-sugar epimerase